MMVRRLSLSLLNGLGSHDTRNTAAGGNQQRDEALTGQSEVTEYTVHNERDTRHVTAVLKDGQEQEQDSHLRNETKNGASTADDTIHYKALQSGRKRLAAASASPAQP